VLPAVPYVDQVYYTAFEVSFLAGAAVLLGSAILLIPAVLGWRTAGGERSAAIVFGVVWLGVMLAAALGNYPTPVVGYGSSAIIGYLLSLAALPRSLSRHAVKEAQQVTEQDHKGPSRFSFIKTLSAAGLILASATSAAGQETADDCRGTVVEKVEVPNTIWQPGPDGKQIALWPDEVELDLPNYDGNPEMIGSGSPLVAGRTWNWATYISRPTMTIYKPKGENTGAVMLVLPGGGYAAVAMDLEGTEICDWITQHGVTCVVLKYRAPQVWRREGGVGIPPDRIFALEDAQRAMSLLRDRSASYDIDPDKIGVIGFSAGAHLATALSNADGAAYAPVDAADAQPWRPDYAIVMYLGRSLARRNPGMDLRLGPWMTISADAPPTLLIHAMNDSANDVRHSIAYGLALDEVGVPVDMRFYATGCHAFGLRPTSDPITTEWPIQAIRWLHSINML
jgi:acetyl esterase/lipase